ncbi:hypothetical protein Ah1_00071 [Aeromonas phage Ah1]|uniref:Uncharacterized protein n=1 Tax=Aeromonas phage Ah1 TaxID=2053701 RepID=A0A2H4YEL5_9CAUD|nr:hypothetical protein KNT77_gp071 [Aeromonas phage Ah1]AUE22612.1 hypothetical protein Ah1_00071 [Aeromonas phage Ah1]
MSTLIASVSLIAIFYSIMHEDRTIRFLVAMFVMVIIITMGMGINDLSLTQCK